MGFIDFVKSAGRKVGLFKESEAAERAEAKEAPPTAEERAARNAAFAAQMVNHVVSLELAVEGLAIEFRGGIATVRGTAPSQADKEKIILAVGNTEGVGGVEDLMEVVSPEPPAVYYTVASGDSLSKISKEHYGVLQLYDGIFEANKPMLAHPDEIYPGQVLRIPPVDAASHTVAKGETLGAIAKHWYGNAKRYTEIFEANRDQLDSADKIEVGQTLRIPVKELVQPEPATPPENVA